MAQNISRSYDNGTYRFEGNVGTEYGVYMKGNYCNVDVNGGSTAYVNFYTLEVYQNHVLNAYGEVICDDNPFESVSIIGTSSKYYNSLVYKRSVYVSS